MNQQWQPHPKGDPPICQDCVYYDGYSCTHEFNMKFSPVSGRHTDLKAHEMRTKGKCGMQGTLFTPKPPSRWKRFKAFFNSEGGSDL